MVKQHNNNNIIEPTKLKDDITILLKHCQAVIGTRLSQRC